MAAWALGVVAATIAAGCQDNSHDNARIPPPAVQVGNGSAARIGPSTDNQPEPPITAAPPRRLWTSEIRDQATMLAYSKELGGERFTKFVLDLRSDEIYYFDVDVYRVHKDFVFNELLKIPLTPASKKSSTSTTATKSLSSRCVIWCITSAPTNGRWRFGPVTG